MRKKRKAADVPSFGRIVEAPSIMGGARIVPTPKWLLAKSKPPDDLIEIATTEEAPPEYIDAWKAIGGAGDTEERKEYNARRLWFDILPMLGSHGTAPLFYKFAEGSGVWHEAAKMIGVLKDGEDVSWYDLDGGQVQYVTLYDLAFVKQPLVTEEGRKLFMMTEDMWTSSEYPPEVGGRTTSKEARPKRRRRA